MDTSPRFLPPGLPDTAAPRDLFDRVLDNLWHTRLRRIRGRLAFALAAFAAVAVYGFSQWAFVWREIGTSSFVEFLRLSISDPDIIFANTKDFSLGLLEALPLGTLLIALSGLFCLVGLGMLFIALRHLRQVPHPHHSSLV